MLAAATSGTGNIEIVYYVIASVIAVGGVAIGAVRLLMWLRTRWTREGEQQAASTKATEDNTAAAKANTEAISALGGKLDKFADRVRDDFGQVHSELNGHRERISRLEMQQGIGRHGGNGGTN